MFVRKIRIDVGLELGDKKEIEQLALEYGKSQGVICRKLIGYLLQRPLLLHEALIDLKQERD